MQSLVVRNVHDALPRAIDWIKFNGHRAESRNGNVLVAPHGVVTTYMRPTERVIFHAERDANPFFHLFESFWMLSGRNDVAYPASIVSTMANFSDDGKTFHGAYGYRWMHQFGMNQIQQIIDNLRANPKCRRQVLGMWDPVTDLTPPEEAKKDHPCNLMISFHIGPFGCLDMSVFCRSNDIIWGAYGANAVHMSILQEFMATAIGVKVGVYNQVSTNWHAYEATLEPLLGLEEYANTNLFPSPYATGEVAPYRLVRDPEAFWSEADMFLSAPEANGYTEPFMKHVAKPMWNAFATYKEHEGEARYTKALELTESIRASDWRKACAEWLLRRLERYRRANDDGVNYEKS